MGEDSLTAKGPIVRIAPDEVIVSDIDAVKTIYAYKDTFIKSPWYGKLAMTSTPNVFNTNDTSTHRRQRKLLAGSMSESSLKHYMPVVASKVDLTIKRMKEEMQTRGVADVWKWWLFMATDVIGELSFGESFMTLEQGKVIALHPCVGRRADLDRNPTTPETWRL